MMGSDRNVALFWSEKFSGKIQQKHQVLAGATFLRFEGTKKNLKFIGMPSPVPGFFVGCQFRIAAKLSANCDDPGCKTDWSEG